MKGGRKKTATREISGEGKCKATEGKEKTDTGTGIDENVWEFKYDPSLTPTLFFLLLNANLINP